MTGSVVKPNRLLRLVNQVNSLAPAPLKGPILSLAFNANIKYAGTTGIAIQKWDDSQAIVHLKNRWRVQNHLKGVHATAMATLAESATGMVFGCHVPDSHLPLLKSMNVQFVKRAQGNLKAVAQITEEQKELIRTNDKGSAVIAVKVTDEAGNEPIHCQMEWAWTTKKRPPDSKKGEA
jgi:acyl-coenzyme A thioesterase PaaI-like protein